MRLFFFYIPKVRDNEYLSIESWSTEFDTALDRASKMLILHKIVTYYETGDEVKPPQLMFPDKSIPNLKNIYVRGLEQLVVLNLSSMNIGSNTENTPWKRARPYLRFTIYIPKW